MEAGTGWRGGLAVESSLPLPGGSSFHHLLVTVCSSFISRSRGTDEAGDGNFVGEPASRDPATRHGDSSRMDRRRDWPAYAPRYSVLAELLSKAP